MTREEKLWAMKGQDLIGIADKYGIKIKCNRPRTQLKEAKANVITKILKVESSDQNNQNNNQSNDQITKTEIEEITKNDDINAGNDVNNVNNVNVPNLNNRDSQTVIAGDQKNEPSAKEKLTPKKGALLEFNGKSQNLCTWAKELGISANTLYGRIYKMGWSIEKAFTTPSRK